MLAREAWREQTPAEKRLWEMLREHRCGGLHFRRQEVIGPFRLDFDCCKLHLAIAVEGSVREEEAEARCGADRQQILEQEFGIHLLRVANEDIWERSQETRECILQAAHEEATGEDQ